LPDHLFDVVWPLEELGAYLRVVLEVRVLAGQLVLVASDLKEKVSVTV